MPEEKRTRITRPKEERLAAINEKIQYHTDCVEKLQIKKQDIDTVLQNHVDRIADLEEQRNRLNNPRKRGRKGKSPLAASPVEGLSLEEFAAALAVSVDELQNKIAAALAAKNAE